MSVTLIIRSDCFARHFTAALETPPLRCRTTERAGTNTPFAKALKGGRHGPTLWFWGWSGPGRVRDEEAKRNPSHCQKHLSSKPTKKTRKRPRQNSSTPIYPSSLTAFDSPQHPPGVISKYSNKPPKPPPSKADVQRELFLQNERRAGQHFHHANLQHTVGKGASLFFSMFEETVQKATLDIDRKIEVKEEVKTGLFRLDKIETVQPKPKRQRSLPQNQGTHTLFLNRALSGVQPPKQLTQGPNRRPHPYL